MTPAERAAARTRCDNAVLAVLRKHRYVWDYRVISSPQCSCGWKWDKVARHDVMVDAWHEHLASVIAALDALDERDALITKAAFIVRETRTYVAAHEPDPQHLTVTMDAFLAAFEQWKAETR